MPRLATAARQVDSYLDTCGLNRQTGGLRPAGQAMPWRISPEPFLLPAEVRLAVSRLGHLIRAFYRAADELYRLSKSRSDIGFVAEYLDAGKPGYLIDMGRHKAFRGQLPLLMRPDILLTKNGPIVTEFDSIPGGAGILAGMERAYTNLGYVMSGTAQAFASALKAAGQDRGAVAIVVSDESDAYRAEMSYLAQQLSSHEMPIFCVHPSEMEYCHGGVEHRGVRIRLVYRFFELFDLDNVPFSRELLEAAMAGKVNVTPPPKAYLEEKSWFALLRHHRLKGHWERLMGSKQFAQLLEHIPETYILDARPAPPQSVIPGLTNRGLPVTDFSDLTGLPRGERQFVIKPSGFSADAWGSRGVFLGRDLSTSAWDARLEESLGSYPEKTYLLQRYHYSVLQEARYYDFITDSAASFEAKVRYCPFYMQGGDGVLFTGGTLVTACPAEKPLIHGMADAVMVPGV